MIVKKFKHEIEKTKYQIERKKMREMEKKKGGWIEKNKGNSLLFIVIKSKPAQRVDPGPGRPGGWTDPSKTKDRPV